MYLLTLFFLVVTSESDEVERAYRQLGASRDYATVKRILEHRKYNVPSDRFDQIVVWLIQGSTDAWDLDMLYLANGYVKHEPIIVDDWVKLGRSGYYALVDVALQERDSAPDDEHSRIISELLEGASEIHDLQIIDLIKSYARKDIINYIKPDKRII